MFHHTLLQIEKKMCSCPCRHICRMICREVNDEILEDDFTEEQDDMSIS